MAKSIIAICAAILFGVFLGARLMAWALDRVVAREIRRKSIIKSETGTYDK